MTDTLVWITGASAGIGAAMAETAPFAGAHLFDISRSGGTPGAEHVPADLADPLSWAALEAHLAAQIGAFEGERLVFVHSAGTLEPMGFADAVDPAAYRRNVLLNAAAPLAVGQAFLRAAATFPGTAHLILLSSGAATSPYSGWSSYCAGKAAVEMWVRTVGEEQRLRAARGEPSVTVLAVAPGVVATAMQEQIRAMPAEQFPSVDKFIGLHERGELRDPADAAHGIWGLLDRELASGSCVDLRTL
jgi:benzil reductase ((S)-benzoin forming)